MPDDRFLPPDPLDPLDPRDAEQDALLRTHHDRLEAAASPDPAFVGSLEGDLLAMPAGTGRRWLFPAAAAVVLVAALVGGAIAGGIFQVREVAQGPTPTPSPEPTLIQTSSDPSASALATVSVAASATASSSPSATSTPTSEPTPSATPTSEPTPSASPTPTISEAPTSGPTGSPPAAPPPPFGCQLLALTDAPVPGYVADSAVASDLRHYTFFWGSQGFESAVEGQTHVMVMDPRDWNVTTRTVAIETGIGTDAQVVGAPDGLLYLFTPGAEGTSVIAYDPAENRFVADGRAELDAQFFDAALGADGEMYLWSPGLEIYRYEPSDDSVEKVAERTWRAEGMVSDPDGRLVLPGPEGVAIYDVELDEWEVIDSDAPLDQTASRPPMAAGPEGRVLIQSADDGGLWYHEDGAWMFERWAMPRETGSVGFVDGRWVWSDAEEVSRLRPGWYSYCVSGPID